MQGTQKVSLIVERLERRVSLRRFIRTSALLALAVGGIGSTLLIASFESVSAFREHSSAQLNDLICGPRCVKSVLDYYNQPSDLIELVREIQFPELEMGSTLENIEHALQIRGIHTCAVHIPYHSRLKWPYPVIVHLQTDNDTMGHFVMWFPGPQLAHNGSEQIKDDLVGQIQNHMHQNRSGAVLLTSPDRITDPQSAVGLVYATSRLLWLAGSVLFGLLPAVGLIRYLRGRRSSQTEERP